MSPIVLTGHFLKKDWKISIGYLRISLIYHHDTGIGYSWLLMGKYKPQFYMNSYLLNFLESEMYSLGSQ